MNYIIGGGIAIICLVILIAFFIDSLPCEPPEDMW